MESNPLQKSWKKCRTIPLFTQGLLSNDWVLSSLKKKVIKKGKMKLKELIKFHMNLIMVQYITDNGRQMDWGTAKVFNYGMMAQFMWGIGKMIRRMARVAWFMLMGMFTKVIGSPIRLKGGGHMSIWMEQSMLEIGKKTGNRGTVWKLGRMELSTKVIMKMEKSTGSAHSDGPMAQFT